MRSGGAEGGGANLPDTQASYILDAMSRGESLETWKDVELIFQYYIQHGNAAQIRRHTKDFIVFYQDEA